MSISWLYLAGGLLWAQQAHLVVILGPACSLNSRPASGMRADELKKRPPLGGSFVVFPDTCNPFPGNEPAKNSPHRGDT